jgi:hypothetical protein
LHRIQRAHELGEVGVEEDPAPTCLGAWNEGALGSHANLLRVHVQEGGGLIEGERPYRAVGRFALDMR